MNASDLSDLFVTTLSRRTAGNRRRWRIALGDVRIYSIETHPHCNWAIAPCGTISENAAIERLADDLRIRHPIVSRG